MGANFQVIDGQIKSFDKLILVFNFNELNEVFNQGFSYSKGKIKDKRNLCGAWRIKRKINS